MKILLIILLPLLLGVAGTLALARRGATAVATCAAAVSAAALALLVSMWSAAIGPDGLTASWTWLPQLGLDLSLRLDALSLLFALLILVIGLLVILYARYYLGPEDPPGRFYGMLMLFMASMLGVVLSDNLVVLAVFWEMTSVASFLLVGYWDRRAEARAGARIALAVTGGGGLALLAGVLLLGHIAGTFRISELAAARDAIVAHAWYPAALALILLGAFTKSAQFPFHFWLPEAMAAPTPVSAYLHSATLVKAGVYLIARLHPSVGGTPLFEIVVAGTGLATLAFGAWVAIFKHDLKGLLAYSTISHLGLIVFLLGLDSPLSTVAAVLHVINHATFKASLFMAAGIIDHETGTRDMRRLNGLFKYMPHTAVLAMVAASAMAGVPLLNGFLSKEMFFAEALDLHDLGILGRIAPFVATAAGMLSVAYSLRFVHDVFFNGEPVHLPRHPHEPPRYMKVPVELLVLVCLAVGMFPGFVEPLVDAAALAAHGSPIPAHDVAIWHGFNLPLLMSVAALGGGVAIYFALQRLYRLHLHVPVAWTALRLFESALDGLARVARSATAALENGSLQRYLAVLIAVAVVLGAQPLIAGGLLTGERPLTPIDAVSAVAGLVLGVAALLAAARHRDRLYSVIAVAVVGLVVTLAFVRLSSPDLALTQLCVEVVSTVVLLLGLAALPREGHVETAPAARAGHVALAGAAGLLVAVLAYAVMTLPTDTIAWYMLEQSVPRGGGANVVNVILVDFRGYDTFGEVAVVAIAALGVALLMRGALGPLGPDAVPGAARLPLLRTAVRLTLPFALLVSAYLFLRGHNAPGGGFIAGLVTASALYAQRIAGLPAAAGAEERKTRWAAAGLGIALATGVAAMVLGKPFLTSAYGHPVLPLLGELPLASAAAFDLGVYLVVVASTLLMLGTLGPSSRGTEERARWNC